MLSCAILLALAAGRVEDPPFKTAPVTVIVLDDVGWELMEQGNTPELDSLAARSLVFRQAWAYPACSSARAAILTGRHAWRTGVGAVVRGQAGERGLALEETTFAELLPERAEAFGKWHVGTGATNPNEQGFDHYAGCLGNLNGPGGRGYRRWARTVNGVTERVTDWATRVTTEDALSSKASLRYVAYHAVHRPLELPPGAPEVPLRPNGKPEELPTVLAMLADLDGEIGRLLEDYPGYVFLVADNGSETAFGGSKGSIDDGGVRVPMLVSGPGIEPGESQEPVSVVDLFATLAEMRGVTIPPGVADDSVSMLPILTGERGTRETVYVERFERFGRDHQRAVASRTHRLSIDGAGQEVLSRVPDGKVVLRPYSGEDAAAADALRGSLPPPPFSLLFRGEPRSIVDARIDSMENDNSRFRVNITVEGSDPFKDIPSIELFIADRREPMLLQRTSVDRDADRTLCTGYFEASDARAAARALGVQLNLRSDPAHRLEAQVEPSGDGAGGWPLRFSITNGGDAPITFLDGGRNRNELGRDNRFTFEVSVAGQALVAREVLDRGGLAVHRTLEPGAVHVIELDLEDWFELPAEGVLEGRLTYEIDIIGGAEYSQDPGDHWDGHIEATVRLVLGPR